MLYVRRAKIGPLYPLLASPDPTAEDIRKFEHLGTRSFAIEQGIGQAIDFHTLIGAERKRERLLYLRQYWMHAVQDLPRIRFYTPDDRAFSGALALVNIEGITPGELAGKLFHDHYIHVTSINWEAVKGVRVTPNVYTTIEEMDSFIKAMRAIAG
jgi:selenocysteine lyase/cysteine desulfurase